MSNIPICVTAGRAIRYWWGVHMPRKRIVKPRLWLFSMAAIALVFSLFYTFQGRSLKQMDREIQQLLAQKEQVETASKELDRKIEFTKSTIYIERVAHEQLGLLRPEEIRIVEAGS